MSKYIEGTFLGEGTYAKVYKAIDSGSGNIVALKKITLKDSEGMPSTALREISILRNITHENIISILEIVHQENLLTIVFEYMDYDLMGYIKVSKCNLIYLMNQLISGIHHMHARRIVHRDLKPNNILVTAKGILKIADFGLARQLSATDYPYSSEVVTLWYRAPELLLGASSYGCEIDIWSLGCIMYEMISKKPLLPGENNNAQLALCKKLNLSNLEKELTNIYKIPPFIIYIMCRCLTVSPIERITAQEIVEYLENKYE